MKKYVYAVASASLCIIGIGVFFGSTGLQSGGDPTIILKSMDGKTIEVDVEVANRFKELRERISKLRLTKKKKITFTIPFNASTIETVVNFSGVPLEPIGVGLSEIMTITDRADIEAMSALVDVTEVAKRVQNIVLCAEFLIAPRRVYMWLGRILTYDRIALPGRLERHVSAETIKNDVARITYLREGKVKKRLKDAKALGFSVAGLIKNRRLKVFSEPQKERPNEPILVLKNNFITSLEGLLLLEVESDGLLMKARDFVFLDLSNNRLSHIKQGDFAGFKLQWLNLSENMFANFPKKSAPGLRTLETLDLASNMLKKLPLGIFSYLGNLEEIRLTGNAFSELNQESFAGLSVIEHLDVGYNRIKTIKKGTFNSVPNVNELFLDNNELTDQSFDATDLLVFKKLEVINLHGNEFSDQRKKRLKNMLELKYPRIKVHL